MEKNITCQECGRLLAQIVGGAGTHKTIKFHAAKVRVDKNALGEELGWLICPKCKAETRFDASYLPGSK